LGEENIPPKVLEITMAEEIWKDIETIPYYQAEWPFHQVSNLGRIRVLPGGTVGGKRVVKAIEIRTLSRQDSGYMTIKQGKNMMYVHRLVLNAFVGPCPPDQECRHLNGNRSDNRWPENIKWGTKEENTEDRARHGMDPVGERNMQAKLTESEVLEIKGLPHLSDRELAKKFGVSYGTIWKIRSGRTWSHVGWRNCRDCGVRTDDIGEWYIVNHDLWESVVPEDKGPDGEYRGGVCLCIGCLETRLGRMLVKEDFTDCPINFHEAPRSDRLLDRMETWWKDMADEWYRVHSIVTPDNPNLYYVD
jgi:hypothetical protein